MSSPLIFVYPILQARSEAVDDPQFPSRLSTWLEQPLELPDDATHFGYVASGNATLDCDSGSFHLTTGMYFSVPGKLRVSGPKSGGLGSGFVASRVAWRGFFQLGGPTEESGRLRYIDGCSDSLLISPVVAGDPCLNLLYLPPHTTQTEHTHPSCRVGMIASGKGVCKTPAETFPLEPGMVFNIAPEALHSFHTSDESLRVIAWHPDSDFGPTHHDHPMINRTIIEGVSAAEKLAGAEVPR
jgi:quercetin dioxygenase-like cupin family protein